MTHSNTNSRQATAILLLILAQPFLDVISYWLNTSGSENTLTLALRLALLLITALWGFCLAENRRPYYLTAAVLAVFTLCHIAACMQAGYTQPIRDLTNLVRIYLLPMTVLSFLTFLRRFPELRSRIPGAFLLCLLVILLVELLATATGTDPHTYHGKGIGLMGWFFATNSQSAILCMLVPISIVFVFRQCSSALPFLAVSLVGMTMLFLFATRLAMLGCVLTGLVLGVCLLLRKHRWQGLWLLALTIAACALIPVSPMTKNQTLVAQNAVLKQENIDTLVAQDTALAESQGLSGDELKLHALESAYDTYLPGLVEQFGLARTAEAYGYSQKASDICDVRRAKLTYSRLLLEDSPMSAKLFGMELGRWYTSSGPYDVENDLQGIFYLCGGAGLALMLGFFLYFALWMLRALLKKKLTLLTPELLAVCTALLSCFAHVYATAGVLRRPNASFYLAVCLALLWKDCRDALKSE